MSSSDHRDGFTKVINWGQALYLEATMLHPGGLKAAVDRIHQNVGKSYGTRNTFKTLFDFDDVPDSDKQRERAYLLLLALGQDPRSWGLGAVTFPPGISLDSLRDQGLSACRCTAHGELVAA